MKRTLVIILAALLAVTSCDTVKIVMDSTSSEGERKIVTSKTPIATVDKGKIYISLGAKISDRDTIAAVIAICDADCGHGIFNRGNAMKFRLNDKSEITLVNMLDKKYETHRDTRVTETVKTGYGYAYAYGPRARRITVHPYQVTALVPEVYTTETTNSYALYLITKEQMTDIITKGVSKMRIEIENRDIDLTDYSTKSISSIFDDMKRCLIEGVRNKSVRTEF